MEVEELKSKLAEATVDLNDKQEALDLALDAIRRQKKDPDEVRSIAVFRKLVEDGQKLVERLTSQIENAERSEKTKTIVEPLIEAFGTVTVPNAVEFRIEFNDMEATFNKLTDQIEALNSRLTAIRALQTAMETVGISPEVAAELKAVRFETVSPLSYKLAIARGGGTRSGGTRASSSNAIHTITEADENHQDLIGLKIGKGQDHETWRALVKAVDPALFDDLELKRKGQHPDTQGKSNWSGALIAERHFGVVATTEEPAAEES